MAETERSILLDANLLTMVAVGLFDPSLVGRKRLDVYARSDFDLLLELISPFIRNLTTPHLLAEASNIADQCVPKNRHREFRHFFQSFIAGLDERWVRAGELCQTEAFAQLGLADAAICRLADQRTTVISADAELCNVLWGRGVPTENFNHLRDR